MAYAGFILAGAENNLGEDRKKIRGGAESRPKDAKKNFPPWEQTRRGAENLVIPRERGRNV